MSSEILERDDLSIYVVAGVPKSFRKKLQKFVEQESRNEGNVMLLDEQLTEWIVARVQGDKRRSHEQTPGSSALWRAYRAMSAARYHLQEHPGLEPRVRDLRNQIEEVWREASPVHDIEVTEPEPETEEEETVGT